MMAMRLSFGFRDGPLGKGHDFRTPSTSRRKSQCMRVAACCCTTNTRFSASASAAPGGGSGVSYTPNANYCNSVSGIPDTFTYTLAPGGSTATVSVTAHV